MARRVRTAKGAEYYGLPVGSIITADLMAKAREKNGGKPAPKGATGTARVATKEPTVRTPPGYVRPLPEAEPVKPAKEPKPPRVKPEGSLRGPEQFKLGSKTYSVPEGSRVYQPKDASDIAYVVPPDGTLHFFTKGGEVQLTPEMQTALKVKMADDASRYTKQETTPDPAKSPKPAAPEAPTEEPKPKSRFGQPTPEKAEQMKADAAKREEAIAKYDEERRARKEADKAQSEEAAKTGLFNEYDPNARVPAETTPLTELGRDPEEDITIYRGVPSEAEGINDGDWVTPNEQLAKDYAGTGKVVSMQVKAKDLMTDPEDDSMEEMVYKPAPAAESSEPPAPSTDAEIPVAEAMAMRPGNSAVNQDHVDKLAEQMSREGKFVGEPVQTEVMGNGSTIVTDGNHRLLAAQKAGLETVPVRTYADTPEGRMAATKSIVDAERRKDANPDGPTYDTPEAKEDTPSKASKFERNPTSLGEGVKPPDEIEVASLRLSPFTGKHITEDGQFTPERQAIHNQIIENFLDGLEPVENPVQYMNGGGPASGKGTMTKGKNAELTNYPPSRKTDDITGDFVPLDGPPQALLIDPDAIKLQFPEVKGSVKNVWDGNPEEHDSHWAAHIHEESSQVAKRLHRAALDRGYNIIYDGTGNGSSKSVRAKVEAARAAGYSVEANYLYLDPQEGLKRALTRAEGSKRIVPEAQITKTYAALPKIFDELKNNGTFDKVNLFDNNVERGKPAVLIGSGDGKDFEIHDEDAYKKYLDSADVATGAMALGNESTQKNKEPKADEAKDRAKEARQKELQTTRSSRASKK
jgi:predicted ABC-type ATPase